MSQSASAHSVDLRNCTFDGQEGGEIFLRWILGAPLPTVSIANVLVTTSMTTKYSLNIHSSELPSSAQYELTTFIMLANHEGIHGYNGAEGKILGTPG